MRWGTRIAPVVAWVVPRLYRTRQKSEAATPTAPPPLPVEHWTAISDGLHNLTTDLAWWRGSYYLVHSSSPWHMASTDSRIIVWSSPDARAWTKIAELRMPGADIRDPKLAVIGDRLFLYVLRNDQLVAEPSATAFTFTDDGVRWAPLSPCGPDGWLFWRPKQRGDRWFVPAYWKDHGRSILLSSTDGASWEEVSRIHDGDRNDETDLEFLPDGTAVVTARLEISDSMFGDDGACTLIATAPPPYTTWTAERCATNRLDGPCLFAYGDTVFAVGRRHRRVRGGRFNRRAGFLGRKRTALYAVDPARRELVHLVDLPSAGDTGYPGVVLHGDSLTICYYTNDPTTDPSWFVGMFLPSEVHIARLSLAKLAQLAHARVGAATIEVTA
ncbi:MAG: hypothetical protein KIT31_28890 [Deltaproteobacteria bacterium]|nr:hypothetical protein [Deltaproteobacteria bacterium]